jgi:hypothetical protein
MLYDEEDGPDEEQPHYCEDCNHWIEQPLDHSPDCPEVQEGEDDTWPDDEC